MPFCKRYHFYEVNDQPWWPQILREKVQNALTLGWINKFPLLQRTSPAALVASLLTSVLSSRISDYTYVDFASGAGGPTPYLERELNAQLRRDGKSEVDFVLTDISPHVGAWEKAAKKSDHLSYVEESVDATDAPGQEVLLKGVTGSKDVKNTKNNKVMRLFSLAFHHFDDELAGRVLKNTFETSDGFCIFELQDRSYSSLLLVTLLQPMLILQTPFYYLRDPLQLLFTYFPPIVPFVVVLDGYISMLRTRTPEEVQALIRKQVSEEEFARWRFRSGTTMHTWPMGYLNWIVCYKED